MSEADAERNKLIADLKRQGYTLAEIGKRYGISKQRVYQIIHGGTYKKKERGVGVVRYDILEFVRTHINKNRYAPTTKEIAEACDCPIACVSYHLKKLHKLGYITRTKNRIRSIALTNKLIVTQVDKMPERTK